jgi:hypothetical protein
MKVLILQSGTALLGLIWLLFPLSVRSDAQPSRPPRVSFFSGLSSAVISTRVQAFRNGLNELGYVEGKNIVCDSAKRAGAGGSSD